MFHDLFVKNNVIVWAIRGNHDFKPYFDNDPEVAVAKEVAKFFWKKNDLENAAKYFDKAIKMCNDLMECFEGQMSGYYNMWIERCEFMKTQSLPKDWNGVFIATSK